MGYWLDRIKDRGKGLIGKVKKKKAGLHLSLMSGYYRNHEPGKAFRESAKLVTLLPYSLRVVPSIVVGLCRSLTGR